MLDLGFLLLAIWSALVGLAILRRLAPIPSHPADALALAVPLGLGTLALATLGLGELGALGPLGIGVVLAVGGGAGLVEVFRSSPLSLGERAGVRVRRIPENPHPGPLPEREGGRWLGPAIDLCLAITILGTLLTALAPVTDGDALCYHLQVPKVFLDRGAVGFEPDLHETIYPLVTEMLYAVALALRGPVACRLIQWLLGLTFAANVAALARPVLGDRARWAAAVALLTPAISNGMGAPLNDVALAAFGNAALVAWLHWRDRPTTGGAVIAGILAGLTLGVKYPSLVWVGLLGVAMAIPRNFKFEISNLKSFMHDRIRYVAIFAAASLLVGGPWYARAYHHTGNPVFPFFRHVFGTGIDEVLDPIKRPMPVNVANVLTALGPLTLEPDRFDSQAHQFGPVFLLFFPGLALLRPPRRVVGIATLGYAFLMICMTQRQSMRFLLIAVGPLAVGAAWTVAAWRDRNGVAGRALALGMALILGAEATLALGRSRHGLAVVCGRESAGSYLGRREPTYRVGRWIDANLPRSARIVGQDHRGFYIPRPYTMELAHRRRTGLGRRGESATEIVAHFRIAGLTHLLMCPPVPESAVEFDPTLGRLLGPWLDGRRPIYRADLADADGVVRRYAIYDLAAVDDRVARGRTRR